MRAPLRAFIGWDPREVEAYAAAEASLRRRASIAIDVRPLMMGHLITRGLYGRPTSRRPDGRLWDVLSNAPMATEFALTRFLVPHLAGYEGWALYCDADFLFRADVAELLDYRREHLALLCVKHTRMPAEGEKMAGQVQTSYPRKNWSSFMLVNCGHVAHAGQVERVHRWPGLRLHQLRWIPDEEIGALPTAWNWLEGVSDPAIVPKAVHYTRGVPSLPGYERAAYAGEWRAELARLSETVEC